jgi:hypothetical protein
MKLANVILLGVNAFLVGANFMTGFFFGLQWYGILAVCFSSMCCVFSGFAIMLAPEK